MITICMTNGGSYDNVNSINGHDASEIKPEIIIEILDNDTEEHRAMNRRTDVSFKIIEQ